jgi:hypothetical protein
LASIEEKQVLLGDVMNVMSRTFFAMRRKIIPCSHYSFVFILAIEAISYGH